jgi:hypothetical protein
MTQTIRVGCASGFWGDSYIAAPQLIEHGSIDYLVFDYLSEITMSIMARAKAKDPNGGYATDFVTVTMAQNARAIADRKIKVIANAGGINPRACAAALEALLAKLGIDLKVAWIEGDDLMPEVERWKATGLTEMFTGAAMPDKPVSMNAYLGAFPIAQALAKGADVVITGRCVDSAVTLGACIHAFGWSPKDYDRLAGGSLAGHIVECGAQACGGVFTDWEKVPDWDRIGYAIAEIAPDGSFVATKPDGTGGLVTPGTVGEQMLYEIGDPQAYMLPDVVCDFSDVRLVQQSKDRVAVTGAKGYPATDSYKVSLTYEDGWRVTSMLSLAGIDAAKKVRRIGDSVLKRMETTMRARNWGPFTETSIEVLGDEDSYGPHRREIGAREATLKLAAKHPSRAPLDVMIRELTSSGTSFAPGITGYGGARAKPSPVVRHFSTLVPKAAVPVTLHIGGEAAPVPIDTAGGYDPAAVVRPRGALAATTHFDASVPLIRLAWARSGDKGDNSNIGIMARDPAYLPYIREALTEASVAKFMAHKFAGGAPGRVERFDLPGISGLNFLLHAALGGGGIASLANDPQGKAYAQMLLEFPVPVPADIAARAA